VRTARARQKIKQWVNHEEETVSRSLGKEILAREVRRRRLEQPDDARLAKAAVALSLADGPGLEIAVGRGDVAIGQVMRALYPDLPGDELQEPKPTVFGRVIDRIRLGRGIKIQGVDGLMVRYAQCCQPVPGDSVVGYVTQGRGISIHRADCPNLLTLAADERRVDIDWQETAGEAFAVRLAVTGEDRRGLYADIMEAISQTGTNIRGADLHTKDGSVFGTIFVEVDNLPHLGKVMKSVRRVKGVTEIERREAPPNQ
jgi:GTP pyrophosphokinase